MHLKFEVSHLSTLIAALANYITKLPPCRIIYTAVTTMTTLQTKYSSKHSKSDSASKSSQPFLSFLSSSSLPSLFPPNTNTPIIYVAILRKPVSSLAFAVIHRVSVAHNTLSFQVVCCLRLIAAVTAVQQL